MFTCSKIAKSIYSKRDRILVIGDLHADYNKTIYLFKKLKLIDDNHNWIAHPKYTFVVQLGDQVDGGGRGMIETSGELQLLKFMEDINKKANAVGGAVISLIGNHEIMNLIGDFRFASNNDINDVGGIDIRKKIFRPGGELFNKLSCTRNVMVKIGNWMFVHAGILPKHLSSNENSELNNDEIIIKMNTLMRLFLQGKKTVDDPQIQQYFLSKDGLIWDRDYGSPNPSCEKWDTASKLLGVGNIVIGHTVQNTINSKCDNRIWRIDVGISSLFETDTTQVLEILDDGVSLPKNMFKPIRIIK
jgi:hypothetical protein